MNISNKISTFALVIIQGLLRQAKANEFRPMRKDAGVAERGGLENRYTGNCIQGSNPCLSARSELAI